MVSIVRTVPPTSPDERTWKYVDRTSTRSLKKVRVYRSRSSGETLPISAAFVNGWSFRYSMISSAVFASIAPPSAEVRPGREGHQHLLRRGVDVHLAGRGDGHVGEQLREDLARHAADQAQFPDRVEQVVLRPVRVRQAEVVGALRAPGTGGVVVVQPVHDGVRHGPVDSEGVEETLKYREAPVVRRVPVRQHETVQVDLPFLVLDGDPDFPVPQFDRQGGSRPDLVEGVVLVVPGVLPQDDPRRAGTGFGQQDAADGIPPVRAGLGRLRPDAEDLVGEGDDEHQDQEGDEEGDPLLVAAESGHGPAGRRRPE